MTVIEGLDSVERLPPGCFATVLKVHHSAIDGELSGVELLNVIHDLAPDAERRDTTEQWEAKPTTHVRPSSSGWHARGDEPGERGAPGRCPAHHPSPAR